MNLLRILTNLLLMVILYCHNFLIPQQQYSRELNSIPFRNQTGAFSNIFSGGINNFEFQFIDIDNDTDYDLFFLDSDGSFGWYRNNGSPGTPSFELMLDSIPGMFFYDWFYFADIDDDKDCDLFTGGTGSYVRFLRNIGTSSDASFELEADTLKDSMGNVVYSESGSNPAFADVDNDGDSDFISGNSNGSLNFYENSGTSSGFSFTFITSTWQDLIIISPANPLFQKASNPELHGSSSIDFADIDNDGDLDLFWGDFFSRSLYYIQNNGSPSSPRMELIHSLYPPAEPVITSGYNMPRLTDINGDNNLDLFVSVLYDPTVPQSMMYYENQGSSASPDLKKQTDNYLNTLDAVTQSAPVFTDIDNDNDLDLFIGSSKNPFGSIMYFTNSGTVKSPDYLLSDSSFFDIQGELSLAPQFGDIDGDNLSDLIVGNFSGTFSFYKNQGTAFAPDYSTADKLNDSAGEIIDAGTQARPFLIDIDTDGDLDIVSGSFSGTFMLYRNTGTMSAYEFTAEPSYFSDLDVGSSSSPYMIDYDSDGDLDLFSGEREGYIFYFRNDGNNLTPTWNLTSTNFLDEDFGADAVPVFTDIDGDTDIDIFIGTIRGGLYFYRNTTITSISTSEYPGKDFSLSQNYPNPFNSISNFEFRIPHPDGSGQVLGQVELKVYDIIGREVAVLVDEEKPAGEYTIRFDASPFASGVYFYKLTAGSYSITRKMILLK